MGIFSRMIKNQKNTSAFIKENFIENNFDNFFKEIFKDKLPKAVALVAGNISKHNSPVNPLFENPKIQQFREQLIFSSKLHNHSFVKDQSMNNEGELSMSNFNSSQTWELSPNTVGIRGAGDSCLIISTTNENFTQVDKFSKEPIDLSSFIKNKHANAHKYKNTMFSNKEFNVESVIEEDCSYIVKSTPLKLTNLREGNLKKSLGGDSLETNKLSSKLDKLKFLKKFRGKPFDDFSLNKKSVNAFETNIQQKDFRDDSFEENLNRKSIANTDVFEYSVIQDCGADVKAFKNEISHSNINKNNFVTHVIDFLNNASPILLSNRIGVSSTFYLEPSPANQAFLKNNFPIKEFLLEYENNREIAENLIKNFYGSRGDKITEEIAKDVNENLTRLILKDVAIDAKNDLDWVMKNETLSNSDKEHVKEYLILLQNWLNTNCDTLVSEFVAARLVSIEQKLIKNVLYNINSGENLASVSEVTSKLNYININESGSNPPTTTNLKGFDKTGTHAVEGFLNQII